MTKQQNASKDDNIQSTQVYATTSSTGTTADNQEQQAPTKQEANQQSSRVKALADQDATNQETASTSQDTNGTWNNWVDPEAKNADKANLVKLKISFISIDSNFNEKLIKNVGNVTITTVKGRDLKAVVQSYLNDQLSQQENYYGPTGDDYVYDKDEHKIGVSPVVAEKQADPVKMSQDNLTDRYNKWLAYKNTNFPFAGYIWDDGENKNTDQSITEDTDLTGTDNGIALIDRDTKTGYRNYWEKIDRTVEFKKYYSDQDLLDNNGTTNAQDIDKANTQAGYAIDYKRNDINEAVNNSSQQQKVSIKEINSTTSTAPHKPDGSNQILYYTLTRRIYVPATGTISNGSNARAGSNTIAIQFGSVDVRKKIGDWTAVSYTMSKDTRGSKDGTASHLQIDNLTEGNDKDHYLVPKSGTGNFLGTKDNSDATGYNTSSYGIDNNAQFLRGGTVVNNPATIYVYYYHDQPVQVIFQDITDSANPQKLSSFSAKDLTINNSKYKAYENSTDLQTLITAVKNAQEAFKQNPTGRNRGRLNAAQKKLDAEQNPNWEQNKYSYQADSNKYSNPDISNDAGGRIKVSGDLDYSSILKSYEDAGYVLVSADADDLDYDKNTVWNSDHTQTNTKTVYVKLVHKLTPITPSDTPKYPSNVKKEDEKQSQITQTRTIKYFDAQAGDSISNLAPDVTQTVTWSRYPVYDTVTGEFKGYAKLDNGGQVVNDSNGNPVIDSSLTDDNSWKVTSTGSNYSAVTSPDLTADGYRDPSLSQTVDNADGSSVAEKDAQPTTAGGEVDVYYWHNIVPVTSTTKNPPKDQSGKDVVDPQSLTKNATRTVHYVADTTGNPELHDQIKQQVTFNGTAYVDMVTKQQVNAKKDDQGKYVQANDDTPTVVWDQGTAGENSTVNSDGTVSFDSEGQNDSELSISATDSKYAQHAGKWYIEEATKDSADGDALSDKFAPSETVPNTVADGNNENVYLIYSQVATQKTEPKSATRTIHRVSAIDYNKYINSDPSKITELAADTTQNVTLTGTYYVDHAGNRVNVKEVLNDKGDPVLGSDGKPIYVVTSGPATETWTVDNASGVSANKDDNQKFDFAAVTDPATFTKDGSTWDQDTTNAVKNGLTTVDPSSPNWKSKLDDGYLLYEQEATPQTETKTATRTIHYVSEKDNTKLKDDTTQTVTLTGTYYTDHSGNRVNAKQIDIDGHKVWVVTGNNPTETWTIDDSKTHNGVTANAQNNQKFDFARVTTPDVIDDSTTGRTNKDGSTWNLDPSKNDANSVTVDPSDLTWTNTLPDGTLYYTKDVNADIKYIDDTTGKTLSSDYDTDEHGKSGQDINFSHDPDTVIKNYEKQGYVLISNDYEDSKGNKQKYTDTDSHFVVHLRHQVQEVTAKTTNVPKGQRSTPAVDPKSLEKSFTRTISYKTTDGKTLKDDTTQNITFEGTTYVDVVTGETTTPETMKDANGQNVQVATAKNGITTWTAVAGDGSTVNVDKNSGTLKGIAQPTITINTGDKYASSGTGVWVRTSDPADEVALTHSSDNPNNVTLYYQQQKTYNIHYIDVNSSPKTSGFTASDGTELTSHEVTNVGDGQYIGDKTNATNKLWTNYADEGYVLVQSPDDLGTQTLTHDTQDQYVYLKHRAVKIDHTTTNVPKGQRDTPAVDPSTLEKTFTRTISYQTTDGKNLKDDTQQKITFEGTAYVDVVTGETTTPETMKDASGQDVQVATTTPGKTTWTAINSDGQPTDHDSWTFAGVSQPTITIKAGDKYAGVGTGVWTRTSKPAAEVTLTHASTNPSNVTLTYQLTSIPWTPLQPAQHVYHWTVHYVDENGKQIQTPVKVNKDYHTGDSYDVTKLGNDYPKTITTTDGKIYELVKTDNGNGTFKDKDQTTVLTYRLKSIPWTPLTPAQHVYHWTVHYVDENGKQIQTPVKVNKDYHTGDSYDVTKLGNDYPKTITTIDGKTYELVKTDNGNGTFKDKDQTTILTYRLKSIPWTPLQPSHKKHPVTPTTEKYTWTINYQTTDGQVLQPDVTVGNNYQDGDKYDVTTTGNTYYPKTLTINGHNYQLVPSRTINGKGTFTNGDQTTTLVYAEVIPWTPLVPGQKTTPDDHPNQPTPQKYSWTVRYVDENGHSLKDSITVGTNYTTTDSYKVTSLPDSEHPQTITTADGRTYGLVKTDNGSGDFTTGDQTTILTYRLKSIPWTPLVPGQPSSQSQPTNSTSPTQPTTPSAPTSPTEPSNPSAPTNPTSPTEPSNPSAPTNPTSPTEPSNPSAPTNPTSPTEPSNPSAPTNPTSPTEPSNPSAPTSPTSPTEPATPGQPTNPTGPATTKQSGLTNVPGNPGMPSTPGQTGQSTMPNNSTVKVSPTAQQSQSQQTAKLPQTGNDHAASLMALGFAGIATLLGLIGKKRKED